MPLRRLAVLASALCLATIGCAQPASAETWTVPHTATITVDGHGYGHGRGLSQQGAEHAAKQGVGYADIVKYYYPGTKWGTTNGGIRVWISNDLTNDVQVQARSGLTAHRVGHDTSWNLTKAKKQATRWRIIPAGDKASVLQFRTNGWHTWKKVSGTLELGASGKPITLYVDGDSVDYRGALRSVPSSPGNRITVNYLPMEAYLRGVVPSETFASVWQQGTLRAQAVAARSYAAYKRVHPQSQAYDVCDTESCQVYGGASVEYPTTDTAVKATAGRILTYDGSPAFTEFSASSGGWTTAGDFPYLQAMPDKYESASDPNESWTVDFSDTELEKAWPSIGDLTGLEIDDRDGNGEWGGRAGTVILTGDAGSVTLTGTAFRQKLHLRSEWLDFTVS